MYRIYLYKFLVDFWVIVPILVPFYNSNGLGAAHLLTIQTAFSVSQMIFEIPSGYVSDVMGRRKTLILAAACMMFGIGIYILSNGFWLFILAEVVLGIAGALRSGTDSAFLYDYLKSIKDEHRYIKCEGTAEFWSKTGTALSSIAGGLFGAYATLRLPFYVNLFSAFLMLVIGISLKEPPREKKPEGNPLKNILAVSYQSVVNRSLFSTMVQMGLLFSTGVTAIWGYFIFYKQYNVPLIWHGLFFALMQLASAFGAKHGNQFEKLAGKQTVAWLLFFPGILFIIAGFAGHIAVLLPLIMIHALIWGLSTPVLLEKIQHQTTSDIRATTLSVGSMIGRIIMISIGPVFGWIIDKSSAGPAFVAMGIFFYIANFSILLYNRRTGEIEDAKQVSIS